jgi:hypothetical protein
VHCAACLGDWPYRTCGVEEDHEGRKPAEKLPAGTAMPTRGRERGPTASQPSAAGRDGDGDVRPRARAHMREPRRAVHAAPTVAAADQPSQPASRRRGHGDSSSPTAVIRSQSSHHPTHHAVNKSRRGRRRKRDVFFRRLPSFFYARPAVALRARSRLLVVALPVASLLGSCSSPPPQSTTHIRLLPSQRCPRLRLLLLLLLASLPRSRTPPFASRI